MYDVYPWAYAPLLVPLLYAGAALASPTTRPFRTPSVCAALAVLVAVGTSVAWALSDAALILAPFSPVGEAALVASRLDVVTATVLPLIALVALVIVRFSRHYLRGEMGRARYARWLMLTLASVTTLVISNNLIVLGLAWVCTSLALHQLLTFYADRPLAMMAAHKKFLASRLADACVFTSFWILGAQSGSFELHVVHQWANDQASFSAAANVAALLLVIGAGLKCAQLPVHGWLLQVMEAPTPVSALLHAGIVNIGGLLMLRLAPFMVRMETAQTLLVAIGTFTAVTAALVMMTRVSVKVSLAWSTCAQMGFMLVQCGLGAYYLALVHLLAHSLYKAHAFLSAGSVVELYRAESLTRPGAGAPSFARLAGATAFAAGSVAVGAAAFGVSFEQEPALWALGSVMVLALGSLLARAESFQTAAWLVAMCVAVACLYFIWHAAFGQVFVHAQPGVSLWVRNAMVITGVGVLIAIQMALQLRPESTFARTVYAKLFAGLYLDELFTRVVFRVWPPKRMPPRGTHNVVVPEAQES